MSQIPAILLALSYLRPEPPIELRSLKPAGGMAVQRFAEYAAAAEWAAGEDQGGSRGVYVVMNPFAESAIRGSAVDDGAVLQREWLLVDVDPTRPKDTNSTEAELEAAAEVAATLREELVGVRGWPEPLEAMSGNGHHLLWRTRLANDPESRDLVNSCLRALAARYGDAAAIDTSVGNAARITKLYGTMARKAPPTPERPWRRSRLLTEPDERPATVPLQLLYDLADELAEDEPADTQAPSVSVSERGTYDAGQVLARVQVLRTFVKDGTEFRDIVCPWSHEHSTSRPDTATVITRRLDTGGWGFRCLHDHCGNRGWPELRDALGIETLGWQERRAAQQKAPQPAAAASAPPVGSAAANAAARKAQRVTVCDAGRFGEITAAMDYYAAHKRMRHSITTGMPRLDGILLGGWRPRMFYLVGGASGGGKSTLLMQWAFTAAEAMPDRRVAVVTPEMSPESLDVRNYARAAAMSLRAYRQDPEGTKTVWAEKTIPQNVRASFDPGDIESFVADEQPGLLIVDYAQQAVSYADNNRHTALAELGARCLEIAKSRDIPVIIGTQVNIAGAGAEKEFSVRETRILSHQADVVIYIDVEYDKGVFDSQGMRVLKEVNLVVDKNRHGATGRVPIAWHRELFRFDQAPAGQHDWSQP